MAEKYYITTAITYTSGKPHIGNTYEIVLADCIARFKRAQGFDVYLQTGTDEHGEKVEQKAAAKGITPKQFVDEVAAEIRRIWDLMDTRYDRFIRTTEADHTETVQKIFEKFIAQGDIYKGTYKGRYCTPCESFWTESQLRDGKCPDCGREVGTAEEEAYFFRMSKYAERLAAYYDEHPEFIVPKSRRNEMVNNFLKPGLQDLCVSRTSFSWGIPVSSDPRHVVYVWLDALSNYITGIGYGRASSDYDKLWPADLHIIGKDIVRFHTIYWPIFLMALGEPLPKRIFGHPWLLQDGGKMSKSRGNVIYADELVSFFGVDAVRYFVLSAMPYDQDGSITWEQIAETVNSDLANVYGNLVSRTIAMSNKYFGGYIDNRGVSRPVDDELKEAAVSAYDKFAAKMEGLRVSEALAEIMAIFRRVNKYIDETEPWVLARDESQKDRLATVLYNLAESILIGTTMLACFMPQTARRVFGFFGAEERGFDSLSEFGLLPSGVKAADKPEILFARRDVSELTEAVERMYSEKESALKSGEAQGVATIDEIGIEDFKKIKLQVGKILTAERVEKSDKLLKFSVDVGGCVRTIVSGIAKYYSAEETIGKQVVVVSNLKPAKLRGIESQGMLLCAVDGDRVVLVSPESGVKSGCEVC